MKNEYSYIYKLKIFAIFSVVCAHAASIDEGTSHANVVASTLLGCIGAMGVPMFFIISGYLFERTSKSLKEFWSSRFKMVIIPWFFCETGLWFYVVLRKGGITFFNWLKFVIGYQSTAYYLTLLILFYILFWKVKKVRWILFGAAGLSAVQIICTGWNIQPMAGLSGIFGTAYLNPFHFMLYFCVGILIGSYNIWDMIAEKSGKYLPISMCCLIVMIILHIQKGWGFSYFSQYTLLNTFLSSTTIMGIAWWMKRNEWNGLDVVGKWSFSIYLLHQFVVGFIVLLTRPIDIWVVTLFRPVITIFIVMMGISILHKMNEKTNGKLQFCLTLIGIR